MKPLQRAASQSPLLFKWHKAGGEGGGKGDVGLEKEEGGRKSQDGGRETGGDKGLFGHHPSLSPFSSESADKKIPRGEEWKPPSS